MVLIAVEMLMRGHRRDADEITALPTEALSFVDVVAAPFEDENLLLDHVAVHAGAAAGRNLLHVEPQPPRRALHLRMREPLQAPLTAPFPRQGRLKWFTH